MVKNADVSAGRDLTPKVTPELLELCLSRVAKAIVRNGKRGEAYLPIYDRLNAEIALMKQKEEKLEEVRNLVRRSMGRT